MTVPAILNFLDHISKSVGLPPIVLFSASALFLLTILFGIIILIKIKNIRSNILILNTSLENLIQMIKRENESEKPEPPKRKTVGENSDTKNNILRLLQETNKPVPYSDIVKQLTKNYPDKNYDYETVLEKLEQLKGEGEITCQLFFGKLYFQMNRTGC
jgi:hypothetical protein